MSRPVVARLGYASSDAAGQLVFCFISFYLLKYYTDVAGLSAAAAGTILLIARLLDAVDAPIWGLIFDRTRSRWGKSRPWFLWLCVPFAISGVLTFAVPDVGPLALVLYCGVTYVLCSILYTGINTPVTSILSALTPDPRERVTLTCYRMFGSKAGVLLVNATALPLVAWFGAGNDRHGFLLAVSLFAFGSVILYLFAFSQLRETIPAETGRIPFARSFAALRGNAPFFILFIGGLCFWIAFIARVSMVPYHFQYTWGRPDLIPLANSLDVVSLAGIFMIPWLCRRVSKTSVWSAGLLGSALSQVVLAIAVAQHSLPLLFVGWIAGIITSGIAMAMPFSLLSESVDYGEWKTGVRAAGLITALGAAFCLKAGSGLGGALPAWILSAHHYMPNVAQSAEALRGISLGFIWLPAFFYAAAFVPALFYRRYERREQLVRDELAARRALANPSAA
jgi:sugar (glycoside-pentoside-hexuronide) transporter